MHTLKPAIVLIDYDYGADRLLREDLLRDPRTLWMNG